MKNLRPNFYDIDNWIILDTMMIKMYDEKETPIMALKVKIGVLDAEEININNTYSKRSFDIIRWITKKEFDRLKNGAGVIVW